MDVDSPEALTLKVRADYNYGDKSMVEITQAIIANTGLWSDSEWFDYDTAMDPATQTNMPLYGSAKNMGVSLYHSGKQNNPFTVSSLISDISVRARQRK